MRTITRRFWPAFVLLLLTAVVGWAQADSAPVPAEFPLLGANAAELVIPGEIVVKLAEGAVPSDLAELGGRVAPLFPGATDVRARWLRVSVPESADSWHAALRYAEHPAVAHAEPNLRAWLTADPNAIPNDPLLPTQYNLHNVGQTGGTVDADVDGWEAGRYYFTHPPVYNPIVAVLDTGIDYNHVEYVGQLLPGYDFVDNDADPYDSEGHGTAAASIIGAKMNNGAGITGLCPNCLIRPVRVGTWVVHFGSISVAQGIFYAADPALGDADIISMSLGGTCSDLWTDAVDYAYGQDVLMAAAAGNYTPVVVYPAAYPRVIGVGATDHNDNIPWWVPPIGTIDLYAPGVDVPVARIGNTYGEMTGTSSATPHVAATAGLMLGQNPALTYPETRQLILDQADEKGGFFSDWLRLNTNRALRQAQNPPGNPDMPGYEACLPIPIAAADRLAFDRAVSNLAPEMATVLQRHRIQVSALLTANPALVDAAAAVSAAPESAQPLVDFLTALGQKANQDLQSDLNELKAALLDA